MVLEVDMIILLSYFMETFRSKAGVSKAVV